MCGTSDGQRSFNFLWQKAVMGDYSESCNGSALSDPSACHSDASDTKLKHKDTEAIELNEVLDKLYQPLSDNKTLNVSHWSELCNDTAIRRYFRMRRRLVTPNDFLARYLYGGSVSTLEECFLESAEVQAVLNFVEESTASANITETELFLRPKKDRKARCGVLSTSLLTSARAVLLSNTLDPAGKFSTLNRVAIQLKVRVHDWLETLANKVVKAPRTATESDYEDIFKLFLKVFSLKCVHGKSAKLGIPYKNERKISSVPDILFRRDLESLYCGVVQVKKMSLDPSLRHAFEEPPKGILNDSGDGQKPSKKRRVNFQPEGAPGTSAKEESEVEETNEHKLDQTDYESDSDSQLTESERQFIQLFFGQLFGSVLGLDCCQLQDLGQRLGIGVVGFRVVFLAFYSKPAIPFKDITREASNRIEVCVTSQLSLLKASDRKEIAKILLALSAPKPRILAEDD